MMKDSRGQDSSDSRVRVVDFMLGYALRANTNLRFYSLAVIDYLLDQFYQFII
jgi:hypothetical protein